ncbi:type II secretion system minor pseudopilin GspI [Pseudoalteromonas mariniglutinosa]|uniref:type II secretion system minor pseudopilin GspI n=1 Tax=Pseudoalteromonas mariniglutinosa TaxID=206042 RepID=UPI0038507485
MYNQHGFTLLEVMVALAICAMAGIAAMQATGEHINHLTTIEEQTYASWAAENVLVEQRAKGDQQAIKNGSKGTETLAGIDWYWRQDVTPTADKSFVKVTINVFTDEQREHAVYELSTYLNTGSQ